MRIPRISAIPHVERHFKSSEVIRDVVIGMSDGLTVPFALAAGISGAIAASHIVITAGVAELATGGISMGLGGYLAARTDVEHFASEKRREEREVAEVPAQERAEVLAIMTSYGLNASDAAKVTDGIISEPARWVDFMMRFELGLEMPDAKRAPISALTIGGSYVIGGLIPLLPYMFVPRSSAALYISAAVTLVALGVFGTVKAYFTGVPWLRGAMQTIFTGGVAAAVAFGIARLVSG